ncbi:uncharacterized protein LOC111617019 [Centruroides sculpturatus]|uniref:uncharacterized protein LOC111617019 n=1 Tax=Centruroides sculpturatus TaxID=218467 RepID=UPI000C6DB8A6|nr:uncharacterized protein LOC111617019 [Centruroides sculpturatus]
MISVLYSKHIFAVIFLFFFCLSEIRLSGAGAEDTNFRVKSGSKKRDLSRSVREQHYLSYLSQMLKSKLEENPILIENELKSNINDEYAVLKAPVAQKNHDSQTFDTEDHPEFIKESEFDVKKKQRSVLNPLINVGSKLKNEANIIREPKHSEKFNINNNYNTGESQNDRSKDGSGFSPKRIDQNWKSHKEKLPEIQYPLSNLFRSKVVNNKNKYNIEKNGENVKSLFTAEKGFDDATDDEKTNEIRKEVEKIFQISLN